MRPSLPAVASRRPSGENSATQASASDFTRGTSCHAGASHIRTTPSLDAVATREPSELTSIQRTSPAPGQSSSSSARVESE
jgi:hypothetical protein